MRDVKREEEATSEVCEKCGKPMVIKWGRNGDFLACTGYPECRNTKEFTRTADGRLTIVSTTAHGQICPTCGSAMVIKRGRFGEFLACTGTPSARPPAPISLGVKCPKPGCGGYLTEKRSQRGKVFFGCSNYSKTQCDFVSWDRPLPQPCPKCGAVPGPEGLEGRHAHALHRKRAAATPPTPRAPRRTKRPRPPRPAPARRRRGRGAPRRLQSARRGQELRPVHDGNRLGDVDLEWDPFPSWPNSLLPQQRTVPSPSSAQEN